MRPPSYLPALLLACLLLWSGPSLLLATSNTLFYFSGSLQGANFTVSYSVLLNATLTSGVDNTASAVFTCVNASGTREYYNQTSLVASNTLELAAPGTVAGNDNVLFAYTTPLFDGGGIGFTSTEPLPYNGYAGVDSINVFWDYTQYTEEGYSGEGFEKGVMSSSLFVLALVPTMPPASSSSSAAPSNASTFTIDLSTGLTASGALATVDHTFDPSWYVYPQAGGPAQQAEVLLSQDPNWPGDDGDPYVENGPRSNWITRDSQVTDNGPAPYSFNRTFVLGANVNLSSVSIEQGQWAIADGGTIILNSITLAVSVDGDTSSSEPWLALASFTAPAGQDLFQYGVNVLQIVITSSNDNYEAARLEGILTYELLSASPTLASSSSASSAPSLSSPPSSILSSSGISTSSSAAVLPSASSSSSSPLASTSSSTLPSSFSSSLPSSAALSSAPPSSSSAASSPSSPPSSTAPASLSSSPASSTAPPAPPPASVLGDPAFVGLLGQSYQVHGVSGLTYALVSDRQVVVNAVFTYLSGGSCLHDSETGLPLYVCWSHAGSYLSAVSVRLASGETLVVRAGGAAAGFAAVELGGAGGAGGVGGAGSAGGVGGAASADGADGTGSTDGAGGAGSTDSTGSATTLTVGSHTTLPSGLTVDYHSLRQLTVRSAGLYQLTLQNSDGFVNLLQLAVSGWSELVGSVQSHGLIGQTWRRRVAGGGVGTGSIPHIEGEVDDYVVRDGLLGCDFMYSKMAC